MSVFPHYRNGIMPRLALLAALLALPAAASPGGARAPGQELEEEDLACLLQLGVETFPERKASATAAVQVPSQLPAAATEPANTTLARHRHASSEPVPQSKLPKLEMRADGAEPRRTAAVLPGNRSDAWESFHALSAASGLQLATRGQDPHIRIFRDVGGWIMFLIGLLFPILIYTAYTVIGWCFARSMGKAIEVAVETYDTAFLGVDVEIGKLMINPFNGHVTIEGLTMDNPKGYKSDYLLAARSVEVDFDMQSLILSKFKHVVVEKVSLKRVDVIYEKTWSSSNVHDVLAFLDGGHKEDAEETAEDTAKKKEKKKKKDPHMEMQEVRLEDVGMRLQGQMLYGHGVRLALADIRFDNFSKEGGVQYIDDILKLLLKSVMKTVVANVVGRRTAEWCC